MITARAGHTFDAILEGAPTGLEGTIGVRVVDPTTQTTVLARTTAGISEFPVGSGVYGATLTAPTDLAANPMPWPVSVLWDSVSGGAPLTPQTTWTEDLLIYSGLVPAAPAATFATPDDVAARLGRTLTVPQEDIATEVIAVVQAQILDEVDRDQDWAETLYPVPPTLKALCVAKAINALSRPEPAIASESLGAHSVTYAREVSSDIFLSEPEKRLVRMAIYGTLTGSSTPRALPDRAIDLQEARDVDEIDA